MNHLSRLGDHESYPAQAGFVKLTESTNNSQSGDASSPVISAFFVLAGDDFDTDACDRAIGFAATEVWRQTRAELRDNPHLENMNWSYGVKYVASFSTNDVIAGVVAEVWPRRTAILEFAKSNELTTSLCCNVIVHEARPVYELSPETMGRLSGLKAEFLLDVVDYSE